jgi:hypothetical protein
MRGSFFFSYIKHNNIKCKNWSHLFLHYYCPLLASVLFVGIHWCFDALEVAYCPNVEVKKRQERDLSEFGDLQLSSWISCWTRIHVSNSIFICYSSSFCQGEMRLFHHVYIYIYKCKCKSQKRKMHLYDFTHCVKLYEVMSTNKWIQHNNFFFLIIIPSFYPGFEFIVIEKELV